MGKNEVVLLDTIVDQARDRFGRTDTSEVFELFCFEQLLKDADLSYAELEAGWTDAPEDGGVDGFFVFVDGRLADSDFVARVGKETPHIRVVVFTIKHRDAFQQDPLNSLIASLPRLFDLRVSDSQLGYPFSELVLTQRKVFAATFQALADRKPRLTIDLFYCSRGDTATLASNLTTRAEHLRAAVEDVLHGATVSVAFRGASELYELAKRQVSYSLRLKFTGNYISRENRNYVALVRLSDYFAFVRDDNGALRRYLFESNVRDYLGKGQVNQDIRASLERRATPQSEDFWWLNNGVTIVATHVTVVASEFSLENVQIVNGLQTTETLYQYFSSQQHQDDERAILVKIIRTSDEDSRVRIIKATNYQSAVELSAIRGLDRIQQNIDHFLSNHGWFYDRKKNFYKNQGRPADRIVSVQYLAAAVRAVALGDPAQSARQRSKSLREQAVYEEVFDASWDLNVFLASLRITHAVEQILREGKAFNDSLNVELIHVVAYVFACLQLKASKYKPNAVSALVESIPAAAQVLSIKEDLRRAGGRVGAAGRGFEGVALTKQFIDAFVSSEHFRARFAVTDPQNEIVEP